MGWLEFKWWIRDNVTDPVSSSIEKKVNNAANTAQQKNKDIHKAGNEIIDAAFDPVGTANKAVGWVKDNPEKVLVGAATAAVTVVSVIAAKKLSSNTSNADRFKIGTIEGPDKPDGGHDHRYNKGPDRTPAQREADKIKRNKK